jgi:hypothetical protein
MPKTLTIVSRKPGFRRAGIAHPARADYPAERFTADELAALKAEPMLEVIETGEDDAKKTKGAA